jgi:hypothetical protein
MMKRSNKFGCSNSDTFHMSRFLLSIYELGPLGRLIPHHLNALFFGVSNLSGEAETSLGSLMCGKLLNTNATCPRAIMV